MFMDRISGIIACSYMNDGSLGNYYKIYPKSKHIFMFILINKPINLPTP